MEPVRIMVGVTDRDLLQEIRDLFVSNQVKMEFIPINKIPDTGIVVLMGGEALDLLRPTGLMSPKSMAIGNAGKRVFGGRILVTYSPVMKFIDTSKLPDIAFTLRKAIRLAKYGSTDPALGKYQWLTGREFLAKVKFHVEAGEFKASFDLETQGLNPFDSTKHIVTVGFSFKEGEGYLYEVPEDGSIPYEMWEALRILSSPPVRLIGANLKFDVHWVREKWGVQMDNQIFDTFVAGSLLDENISNSLETHAKIYTSLGGYDTEFNLAHDKGEMSKALKEDRDGFLTYGAGDCDAALRVYSSIRPKLANDKRLANLYVKVLQPALKVFTKMEARGVVVDEKQYDVLQAELTHEIQDLKAQALKFIPNRLKIKHREKDGSIKLKPSLLSDFMFSEAGMAMIPELFSEKTKEPGTDKHHLALMAQRYPEFAPFAKIYSDYSQATKCLTTYIIGFRKHLQSDGKFHPQYRLAKAEYGEGKDKDEGTDTGRTSATAPAMQTLPKHNKYAKRLRTVFVPPPGYVGLSLDFSQGELRIFASLAQCTRMMNVFRKGEDLHYITGAQVSGLNAEQLAALPPAELKKVRQGGKAGNFGLIYKISPAGFQVYAKNTYQVDLSLTDAEKFHHTFHEDLYPEVGKYHRDQITIAGRDLQVRGPLGRIRHLPLIRSKNSAVRGTAERNAINSPTQGTLSDMGLLAMVEMDKRRPDTWFYGFVHDDLQFYAPEDNWQEYALELQDIMQNLPLKQYFGWDIGVPIVADIGYYTDTMSNMLDWPDA